ncbi:polysaccharide deacetylase family protein [Chloroflexota bacterium]
MAKRFISSTVVNTKCAVAKATSFVMADRVLLSLQRKLHNNAYIRAVNYHQTPAETASNFEKQLEFYKHHFCPVSLPDLSRFLNSREWEKDKPGLIISFDDGFKNNYEVAAPLLEEFGFTGWFFVPTAFIYTPGVEQPKYIDGYVTMSWDELRKLDRKHVIGCHTETHHRMVASTSEEKLDEEIIQSKHFLEEKLGHQVDIFCWCGGEKSSYSGAAAKYISKAGYQYAFMTNCAPILFTTDSLHLQRTNIESHWPIELVKYQLCGLMDILYTPFRIWVDRMTNI